MSNKDTSEAHRIGMAIRHIRDGKRLSRASLSLDSNVDPSTIGMLETGTGNPTLGTIEKIADVLKTDLDNLMLLGNKLRMAEEPGLREVLSQNVRAARLYRGLTQQRLANITNTTVSYISGLERGKIGASIDKIGILAHALNTEPGHLLFRDFPENAQSYMSK